MAERPVAGIATAPEIYTSTGEGSTLNNFGKTDVDWSEKKAVFEASTPDFDEYIDPPRQKFSIEVPILWDINGWDGKW